MKHLKPLYILIAVLIAAVPYFAKDKIIESKWAAMPLQIDGQTAEWAQDVLETSKSEQVSYAFKNDANHLYVLFIFNESKTLSSISATGMTFWINTEGKEKKNYGMRFYLRQLTGEQLVKEMEKQGETIPEEKKQELLKSKSPFRLFACDAVNKKGEIIPHPGKGMATFRAGRVEKNTVYEFVIPIALLNDPASTTPFDVAKPFKLGFDWGGMTDEMKKAQAANLGDQGARASASEANLESQIREGEGSGFRVPDASLTGMRSKFKRYEIWIDLKIAQTQ